MAQNQLEGNKLKKIHGRNISNARGSLSVTLNLFTYCLLWSPGEISQIQVDPPEIFYHPKFSHSFAVSTTCHFNPSFNYRISGRTSYSWQAFCAKQLNPLGFSYSSTSWISGPSTLLLTFGSLTQFSHHILPVLRKHWYPNTQGLCISSALKGHGSGPHSTTVLTAIVHIRHLIDNKMSCRYQKCLRLVNDNRVLYMRADTSFDIKTVSWGLAT